jgi:hypothetical protein
MATVSKISHIDQLVAPARALLEKALPHATTENLTELFADPAAWLIVAEEDNAPRGFAIGYAPSALVLATPYCAYFYNDGSAGVRHALVDAFVAEIRARGFTTYLALNATGKKDAVWSRLFERGGAAKTLGSVMLLTAPAT